MADREESSHAPLPRHLAIIMDGNGRWAVRQGLPRMIGHQEGARNVRRIVTRCAQLHREVGGLEYLTLYSFSLENWKRPADEVDFLMRMYVDYLESELPVMMENGIRFRRIGRVDNLPQFVMDATQRCEELTAGNTGLTLVLAMNYGSRAEITDAVRAIAEKVADGALRAQDVTEDLVSGHLYTAGMPDPDLLVRTAGEMRVSNYLLWQISYAELYISAVNWPEFDAAELDRSMQAYGLRNRRFGALDKTNTLQADY